MRKPTLSPSKISTYLACPIKYRWTYVDARGRFYLRSKHYYSFGSSLHRVLEKFHKSGDRGADVKFEAAAELEESWIDAGYSSAQEMQEALGEGKAIVEAYVERVSLKPSKGKTIFVEKTLRADMEGWTLLGRLDRVDEMPDGSIRVVDYKSGREGVTEEDVRGDLAMSSYQLLLREKYPMFPVSAEIIALRGNESAVCSMSSEELEEFRKDLLFIGIEILNRDYENVEPIAKPLCKTCDFLPLCKKHPDFELN